MSLRIGVYGFGVVGSALGNWLSENTSHNILASDPAKGLNADMSGINVAFVAVPVPTDKQGTQDYSILVDVISKIPAGVPIFVRSTVLPGTCKRLTIAFKRPVFAMPEFLTQRRAYEDMCNLPIICGGGADILERVFQGQKQITEMLNDEAELAKYAHNCFGAIKVNYFNQIYSIAKSIGADYDNVLRGAMLTGFIEKTHTQVPGPDGRFGFGGACFPKDLKAFASYAEQFKSLTEVVKENEAFRENVAEPFAWATPVGEA